MSRFMLYNKKNLKNTNQQSSVTATDDNHRITNNLVVT